MAWAHAMLWADVTRMWGTRIIREPVRDSVFMFMVFDPLVFVNIASQTCVCVHVLIMEGGCAYCL